MTDLRSFAAGSVDAQRSGAAASERQAEVDAILKWLNRGSPAIVSITGPRGSGKSFVTEAVVNRAAAIGWHVTPYQDGRGIRVGSGTTEKHFAADVAAVLEIGAPQSGRRLLRAVANSVVDAAARTPALLVLDPFAPGKEVLERLNRDFFPTLRASEVPVVVLVVCRQSLRDLLPIDFELLVSVPTQDKVSSSLTALVADVGLELIPGELEAYVAAAGRSPRLLTSLMAVLPYGAYETGAATSDSGTVTS